MEHQLSPVKMLANNRGFIYKVKFTSKKSINKLCNESYPNK